MSAVMQGTPDASAFRKLKVELLCGAGGAAIGGLDVSKPLLEETIAELRRALADYCVLIFRD